VVKSKKINVGISIGDPNGIGIEVMLKALSDSPSNDNCNYIIYSSHELIINQKKDLNINTLPIKKIESFDEISHDSLNIKEVFTGSEYEFGSLDKKVSQKAIISFKEAVKDANEKKIDVLITSPIDKNLSYSESFKHSGHTDYLRHYFNEDPIMLMVSKKLKVGLLTEHIALKDVVRNITVEKTTKKLKLLCQVLNKDFGIIKPKIAVLSINPHVGDNGVIGTEDQKLLTPAINELNQKENIIYGPFSADTFFCNNNYVKYDAILAVYHDQGLIPFKTISFGEGVNYSAGLPIIRTSPDHGTGFDIAGKSIADPSSFKHALKLALNIYEIRNKIL
jgi:4-hydroxythreonine-4-phosphate dehydrogenase